MRKLTKILTAVLVLCMLCGVIALTASAADTEESYNLSPAGATHSWNQAEDFTDAVLARNALNGIFNSFYSDNSQFGAVEIKTTPEGGNYLSLRANTDSNGAVSYTGKTGAAKYGSIQQNYTPWTGTTPKTILAANPSEAVPAVGNLDGVTVGEVKGTQLKAVTIDFDFGSNQYAWEVNGVTYMGTEPPAEAENVRLALDAFSDTKASGNKYFCLVFRSPQYNSTTGAWENAGASSYYYIALYLDEDNDWCMAYATGVKRDNIQKNNAVKLSNKLGAFDHVNVLINPASTVGLANVEVFVNGQSLGAKTVGSTQSSDTDDRRVVFLDELRIDFDTETSLKAYDIMFDNYAVTYYPADYTSGDSVVGIDDYLAGNAAHLYDCEDVVYKAGYIVPNASYIKVADNKKVTNSFEFAAALEKLGDGETIILDGATVENAIVPASVESFKVKLYNGAEFHLDSSVPLYKNSEQEGDGYVEISYSNEVPEDWKIPVKWYSKNPEGLENPEDYLIAETVGIKGFSPIEDMPHIGNAILDRKTGEISSFVGWRWNPLGEGESEVGEIDTDILDAKLMEEIDYVAIYPEVEDAGRAAFGVYDADGNIISYNTSLGTNNANLSSALNTNGATVVLFDDDDDGILSVNFQNLVTYTAQTQGFEITLDLNGLHVISLGTSGSSSGFFRVRENNYKINIKNGTATCLDNCVSTSSSEDVYGLGGLVYMDQAFVDKLDVNLDNVNFNGGSVVYFIADRDAQALGGERLTVNVNGGTYYSFARPGYGLFAVLAPDVTVNVYNANLIVKTTVNSYGIIGTYPSGHVSQDLKFNCYNSTIISTDLAGTSTKPMFYGGALGRSDGTGYLTAYFEGCTIYAGSVARGDEVSFVSLGAGNKLAGSFADSFKTETAGYQNLNEGTIGYFVPSNTAGSATVSYPQNMTMSVDAFPALSDAYFAPASEYTYNFTIAYETYDITNTDNIPEGFAAVTFDDGNGNTESFVYQIGHTIDGNPTSLTLPIIDDNNGWYVIETSWLNEATNKNVVVEGTNVFKPIGKTPVEALKGIKINVNLYSGELMLNLYVPVPTLSEVTVQEKFISSGWSGIKNDPVGDGKDYYNVYAYAGINNFSDYTDRYVTYTVNYDSDGDGVTEAFTLKKQVKYGTITYLSKVAEQYAGCCDEAKLARAILDYMVEMTKAFGTYSAANELAANAVYEKLDHGAGCTCKIDLNNIVYDTYEDTTAYTSSKPSINKVADGFTWSWHGGKPWYMLQIDKTKLAAVLGIDASELTTSTLTDYITVTMYTVTDLSGDYMLPGVSDGGYGFNNFVDNGDKILIGGSTTKVYAARTAARIQIKINSDSSVYESYYSLKDHIAYCEANGETSTTAMKAFWAYSKAALDYKILTPEEQQ